MAVNGPMMYSGGGGMYPSSGDRTGSNGSEKFPNPFYDVASDFIPTDINTVFEWAEYMQCHMGLWRMASRRVVRYFLTEVILEGESDEEREDYLKFLNDDLRIKTELAQIGDEFMCFSGETAAITDSGVYTLAELEGKTVNVLSKDGVYRTAEFKQFGVQKLLEVEFSDGRKVYATPEHEWHVRKDGGDLTVVPTTALQHRLVPRVINHRPEYDITHWDGTFVQVTAVRTTDRIETVYCCVEPETHTFVLGNGVLTGNCYGNVFVSVYFPFDRFLICPKCHTNYHIDKLPYTYQSSDATFQATCPKCHRQGAMSHDDRRSNDRSKVKIIRWNPKQIRMRLHPISGETTYYWEMPMDFVQKLREGDHFYVRSTPWAVLKCCSGGAGAQMPLFEFDSDAIFHMRETSLAGLPILGWGIPPVLPNFKLAYYIQVLRRFDEAIAHDFIVPFRVIYPDFGPSGAQDPLRQDSMAVFSAQMQAMVKKHRQDPTTVQVAPYKVGYEMLGGEGNNLTPKDQIAAATDELLNSLGYPAELYKGTLSIQAFPVALRLFEMTWNTLVDGNNQLLAFLTKKISRHFMWGNITGKLRSVTLADDLERKALSLQGAAGMDISKGTAYQPFGINYMDEQRKIVEEQEAMAKLQQEAMAEQQAMQGLEGANGGGGPGGQPGATPGDVHEQAKQLAQQLLFNTPETMRRGELIKIKHSNPTLHALVIQEMDNQRYEMQRQGGAQMMEQMKGQGAPAGGMVAQAAALPSAYEVMGLVAEQALSYSRDDLKKIAHDAKRNPHAKTAFSYIYRIARGWQ